MLALGNINDMDSDDVDHYYEEVEENEDMEVFPTACFKDLCIGFGFFVLCVSIASIVAISIVSTYKVVQRMAVIEVDPIPFRSVNHGIWPGYRHEFFNERLPYSKAEQVCLSREKASLLHFNSQEQEDAFDMYASLNFWSATDYPSFQLWTLGIVIARRVQGKPNVTVLWPEPTPELSNIRECAVRGEGLVNAFGFPEKFWQERHIVKDYITENQPESGNTTKARIGCWQHVKRNDWVPESFYRFVCQRKI